MRNALYAGSFDPITNGHLWIIREAASLFHQRTVAVGMNPEKKCTFTLDRHLAGSTAAEDPKAIQFALWFHDAIYDARRNDNEEASAAIAAKALAEMGFPSDFARHTANLIVATKHSGESLQNDAMVVCDCDLTILGASASEFDAYEAGIRKEYGHVSDDDYRRGRAEFLQKLLARPWLFATTEFRERLEHRARENLSHLIARLGIPRMA